MKEFVTEEDLNHYNGYPLVGMHVVETGGCKIIQEGADGKKRLVAVIGRNDAFGAASLLKIAVSI